MDTQTLSNKPQKTESELMIPAEIQEMLDLGESFSVEDWETIVEEWSAEVQALALHALRMPQKVKQEKLASSEGKALVREYIKNKDYHLIFPIYLSEEVAAKMIKAIEKKSTHEHLLELGKGAVETGRHKIRQDISNLLFDLSELQKNDSYKGRLVALAEAQKIKWEDVQAEFFVEFLLSKVEEILQDKSFWRAIPEKQDEPHSLSDKISEKDDLKRKLAMLVEGYRQFR